MIPIDITQCTGCGACSQRCPKGCISFHPGELGVLLPDINTGKCIQCGLCEMVCPITTPVSTVTQQQAYAVVNRDKDVLADSTSGGFFTALAHYVLNRQGVVYGCAFDENFQAKHIRVEQETGLYALRGSKYVQSDTGQTFAETKAMLEQGRMVLYTGTPCQIEGLKGFLGKPYRNLITADIVCHGVGSQAYFDRYMEFLRQKYAAVKELHFRRKKFAGWSCGGVIVLDYKSQMVQKPYYDYNNYYYYYYLRGDIYRQSCYQCKYANLNRPADFTMGDFWGAEGCRLDMDTFGGCSLVIVNTEKGKACFGQLAEEIKFAEVPVEQAVKANGQLKHPSPQSVRRDELARQYQTMDGKQIDAAFRMNHRKQIRKLHLKALIPYAVKVKLRKLR